jgi:hypothetical protein
MALGHLVRASTDVGTPGFDCIRFFIFPVVWAALGVDDRASRMSTILRGIVIPNLESRYEQGMHRLFAWVGMLWRAMESTTDHGRLARKRTFRE